jgi:hypothetical protein
MSKPNAKVRATETTTASEIVEDGGEGELSDAGASTYSGGDYRQTPVVEDPRRRWKKRCYIGYSCQHYEQDSHCRG